VEISFDEQTKFASAVDCAFVKQIYHAFTVEVSPFNAQTRLAFVVDSSFHEQTNPVL
jgi:hypothetical protein